MHFQTTLAVLGPLFAVLTTASPIVDRSPQGSVSAGGPPDIPPNCYHPHGAEDHEIICTYISDDPDAYSGIKDSLPDTCEEDPEDGADIVCYLPSFPDFDKRDASVQDAYVFRLWCDTATGCHVTGLPKISRREASPNMDAYGLSIRIRISF